MVYRVRRSARQVCHLQIQPVCWRRAGLGAGRAAGLASAAQPRMHETTARPGKSASNPRACGGLGGRRTWCPIAMLVVNAVEMARWSEGLGVCLTRSWSSKRDVSAQLSRAAERHVTHLSRPKECAADWVQAFAEACVNHHLYTLSSKIFWSASVKA